MDLQAIEARLEAITETPWEERSEGIGEPWFVVHDSEYVAYVASLRSDQPADAEFIARAPEDIRVLLGAVKAVRELHRKVPLYDTPADECTEHDQDVYSIELDSGEWYCSEHIAEWVCSECFNDGGEYVDYPCETARALGVTE